MTEGKRYKVQIDTRLHEVTNHNMHQTSQQSELKTFQPFLVVQVRLICPTAR